MDAAGNASAQSSAANVTTPAGGGSPLTYAVVGSYDDMYAYEDAGSGSYSRTSTHVFTADNTPTSYDYRSGFRFRALTLPVGATVNGASLTITADATAGTRPPTTLRGQGADNAADFANDNHNTFLARARTSATIPWTPSALDQRHRLHHA